MNIDNVNSNWIMAQQATDKGAKAVEDAQNFADELKRASENVAKPKTKAATAADGEMTPEQKAYDKKLREACQGFEAMFLNIMYKEMRNTVPENSLFGDGLPAGAHHFSACFEGFGSRRKCTQGKENLRDARHCDCL